MIKKNIEQQIKVLKDTIAWFKTQSNHITAGGCIRRFLELKNALNTLETASDKGLYNDDKL